MSASGLLALRFFVAGFDSLVFGAGGEVGDDSVSFFSVMASGSSIVSSCSVSVVCSSGTTASAVSSGGAGSGTSSVSAISLPVSAVSSGVSVVSCGGSSMVGESTVEADGVLIIPNGRMRATSNIDIRFLNI
ncbi:hypothetical protein [Listeria booriae]|uniref:hypothetical protein n=1 Tax=Listeria booriae TaxID=1552123 RepID=UPI001C8A7C87|nr:hypothetical protein [Listeria booriae]